MYNELEERNGRTHLKLNRTYILKHLLISYFLIKCVSFPKVDFLILFFTEAYLIYNIILTSSM